MLVTIRGTAPTDTLDEGEIVTVELTPFIRGMLRNGLAVQVPRPIPQFAEGGIVEQPSNQALAKLSPNAREFALAPAKKTPARKAAAKKVVEADAKVLEAAVDARDAAHALSAARADAAGELADMPLSDVE